MIPDVASTVALRAYASDPYVSNPYVSRTAEADSHLSSESVPNPRLLRGSTAAPLLD